MLLKPTFCVGILLVLSVAVVLWADEEKPGAFKSQTARVAKGQFTARLAEIQQDADAKIAAARKQYAKDLMKARDDATRRADLDEANRIQAELKGVGKPSLARPILHPDWTAREVLVPKLAGSTWLMGGENRLTLKADGTTSPRSDGVGAQWAPIGESAVIVLYEDGWIDLWRIGERLTSATASHAKLGETPERVRVP
jgi:hypothetical protein